MDELRDIDPFEDGGWLDTEVDTSRRPMLSFVVSRAPSGDHVLASISGAEVLGDCDAPGCPCPTKADLERLLGAAADRLAHPSRAVNVGVGVTDTSPLHPTPLYAQMQNTVNSIGTPTYLEPEPEPEPLSQLERLGLVTVVAVVMLGLFFLTRWALT